MFRRLVSVVLLGGISFAPNWAISQNQSSNANVSPPAQEMPDTVFRSESRLVVLDAVAYDKNGAPIRGLKASDFEVLENGVPQTITQFEPHTSVAAGSSYHVPFLPPGAVTNYAQSAPADALVVILLDNLNTEFLDQARVRAEIAKFLRNVKPGTRLCLYSMGTKLLMLHGFTQNPDEILAAMNGLQGLPSASPLKDTLDKAAPVRVSKQTNASSKKTFLDARVSLDHSPERAGMRTQYTDQFLRELIANLAPMHGRKSILWFSGQFPFTVEPDSAMDGADDAGSVAEELRQITDMLINSQISIYPIDAAGLNGNNPKALDQLTTGQIAEDTGGRAFYNTNAIAEAISVAAEEAENYYTIAYAPKDRNWDGKFRHITVRTPGINASVSYHHGYYGRLDQSDSPVQKTAAFFAKTDSTAFLHGAPYQTEIIFSITAEPAKSGGASPTNRATSSSGPPRQPYIVHFNVRPEELQFRLGTDGKHLADLQVAAVAYDVSGKQLSSKSILFPLSLTDGDYQRAQASAISFSESLDVPVGGVYIRAVVHDLKSLKTGSVETSALVGPTKQ